MEQKFSVGDIVTVPGTTQIQGEVVEVGDYVGVRVPASGTVLSYWPQELAATGRRIHPDKLASVHALTRTLEDAERIAHSLRRLRETFVLESIVEQEQA